MNHHITKTHNISKVLPVVDGVLVDVEVDVVVVVVVLVAEIIIQKITYKQNILLP